MCDDPVYVAIHPIQCGGEAAKGKVQDTLSQPLEDLVNGMLDRAVDSLVYFMTFWLKTPSASLSEDDPVGAAIVQLQGYLTTITVFFAVMGVMIAAARMAWMARVEPVKEIAVMFLRVLFVQAAALMGTQILLRSGDAFSPWLVETALESTMNHSITTLFPFITGNEGAYAAGGAFVATQGVGAMLIIGIIVLIASILQVLFLLLRDVLLAILLAFLPTLAAASLFKSGSEGFEKALGWIVALCLYKPIAAAIYVLGTLMVKNVAGDQIDPGQEWMALILGTMTLLLAVFAMPALVKFVAPAAGRGASSAFSGGAAVGAVGGVVATGAAVAALAGTGGAAAGAGAGAGGGATGAAAAEPVTAGTGAGSTATAGASPPPTDGAPASTPEGGGGDSSPSGSDSPGGNSSGGNGNGGEGAPSGGPSGSENSSGGDGGGDTGTPTGAPSSPTSESSGSGAQALQTVAGEVADSGDDSGAALEDLTQ
ncbi:MAG TPA: hypothetical protein VK046_02950 [Actinomycetaceae bacterium]|nr:hypothetical protein [Actinomycetaceae bacterium]